MKPYLLSLGAGLLIGILYSLLGVKSPAPPLVALAGLLGILLGEQAEPVARRIVAGSPVADAGTRPFAVRLPGDDDGSGRA